MIEGTEITLADYLWARIYELGVRSVHGVPGDYNLSLLDNISSTGLKWIGNCNELNAGYGADGYARVAGVGALVTTGGVGELSALNAHAGAYSEYVPLIHIVGSPPLRARKKQGFCMHHSLGGHDYSIFKDMFRPICAAQVTLDHPERAAQDIDEVLKACWTSHRPVYIEVPSDMNAVVIESHRLKTPLDISYPVSSTLVEGQIMEKVNQQLQTAVQPCILVDMLATRQRVTMELHTFLSKSGLPVFVTPQSQGLIDESLPNFAGLYAGRASSPGAQELVEQSDLVLHLGPLDTDVTTLLGTAILTAENTVRFLSDEVRVSGTSFMGVDLRSLLLLLADGLKIPRGGWGTVAGQRVEGNTCGQDTAVISQDWLWSILGDYLQRGDIILTDTGTASFGIFETKLPPRALLINTSLWASIGYSLPSASGAALAVRDSAQARRTIVFQGDGSFQLTCQEISTMIKHRLQVIIFVICNNGYTIERAVHDTRENYNDVANWDYKAILSVFDRTSEFSRSVQVKTQLELMTYLKSKEFDSYEGVQLIELYTPELDIPRPLRELAGIIKLNTDKQ